MTNPREIAEGIAYHDSNATQAPLNSEAPINIQTKMLKLLTSVVIHFTQGKLLPY